MAKVGSKLGQVEASWGQVGPKCSQVGSSWVQAGAKLVTRWAKLAPNMQLERTFQAIKKIKKC
eukprot:2075046-Karenia_brevis.AAC.1